MYTHSYKIEGLRDYGHVHIFTKTVIHNMSCTGHKFLVNDVCTCVHGSHDLRVP